MSNGTLLTAAILEEIKRLRLHLAISLDGIGAYHDRQRHYADGTGSCNAVLQAVELACAHGITPYISIVVTGNNAAGLPDLISWVLERDLPFNLSFARNRHCARILNGADSEQRSILDGMLAAYSVIEKKLPRRSLLNSLLDNATLSDRHLHPCSAGKHYMAFDCAGGIAKCQMEYGRPVTSIKAADPLAELRRSAVGVQNISIEDKAECRSCEWKYWCAGGCPLSAFATAGRYDAKSPNCAVYQKLYPEVFRLEQLRHRQHATA